MKKIGLFVTLIYFLAACGTGSTDQAEDQEVAQEEQSDEHPSSEHPGDDDAEWAEAESFHEIMALTYHPMRDEGKMEPVSENAEELLAKAKVWAAAEVPGNLDADVVSSSLATLVSQSEKLVELVGASAGEEELKQQVNNIHDTFHKLHEMMEGEHEEGEHEHPDGGGEHPDN